MTKFTFNKQWDKRFMEIALTISKWSKDPSTQVGCVIVDKNKRILSTGYNGFPRGVIEKNNRFERPQKYEYTEHSERNAIFNAVATGVKTQDSIIYITMPPCTDCARAIIQSGIKELIYLPQPENDAKITGWRDSIPISFQMLHEAGIKIKKLPR